MTPSSRLIPNLPAIPTRAAKPGPCFRTDAEGRIPLITDWAKLFTDARRFDALALQTRHSFVRLIHIDRLPELAWVDGSASTGLDHGSLRLHPAHWSHAVGRLAECACCGTPGRVEILNAHGLDFLQLCALPDCAPSTWADDTLLLTLAASANAGDAARWHAALRSTFATTL